MQVAEHHKPGTAVLVQFGYGTASKPAEFLPGVVDAVLPADDRDYRLSVRGTGHATGRLWSPCAPEFVTVTA